MLTRFTDIYAALAGDELTQWFVLCIFVFRWTLLQPGLAVLKMEIIPPRVTVMDASYLMITNMDLYSQKMTLFTSYHLEEAAIGAAGLCKSVFISYANQYS